MSDELNFDADEFLMLPVLERVRLCRLLSKRAHHLAEKAEPAFSAPYAAIANGWRELADEMEKLSALVPASGRIYLLPQ